jgi:signal transduction histidine kinase
MLSSLLPDRLSQWLAVLVVGGILATQAMALTLYHSDRTRALEVSEAREAQQCLAGFAQILAPESTEQRRALLGPLMRASPPVMNSTPQAGTPPPARYSIRLPGAPPPAERNLFRPFKADTLPSGPTEAHLVEGQLADGTRLSLEVPRLFGDVFTPEFIAYIAGVIIVGLLGSLWAIALATRPLRRLSDAADRFGGDFNAAPVAETGPREVRRAAAAFNRMQRRLRQFILERTGMLAAISHDLRTPLTRMRLRAEMIDDAEQRAKMLNDVAEMDEMVGAALAFARAEAIEEKTEPVDLSALLDAIVEDAKLAGQSVTAEDLPCLHVAARPMALKRGLVNIVDNAVRYGGGAEIALSRIEDEAVIRIVDHGPGIPAGERDLVLRPFYRCEASRSRDTGGIGLGLSIAADSVAAHGGRLTMLETPGGGLTVEVRLAAA